MLLAIWIFILLVSLVVLAKSGDYFTDSAEKIGIAFRIPSFIIGVTIVSIGTSLPEFVTSILAMLAGKPDIVIGNVLGSNITNIFLGLGMLPLIIGFFKIGKNLISTDLPILVGSTFLLVVTFYDGKFTPAEAIFCLAGFVVYILYAVKDHHEIKKEVEEIAKKPVKITTKTYILLLAGCLFLFLSARVAIESITQISELSGLKRYAVSGSILALGTSLPEIITSIVVIKKGKIDIAVGTLFGSNIFNAFAIMGFSGLIGTIIIPEEMLIYGIGMLTLSTLLYFFITQDQEITVWEGCLLIIFYVLYILKLYGIV